MGATELNNGIVVGSFCRHDAPMIPIRLIVIESPRIVEYRFHGANYQPFERWA